MNRCSYRSLIAVFFVSLLIAALPHSAAAATVFSAGFDGNSGSVPAGWTDIGFDSSPESTVIESGTVVAVTDFRTATEGGGPQLIQSNFSFTAPSAPAATVQLTVQIASLSPAADTDAIVAVGSPLSTGIVAVFHAGPNEFTLAVAQAGTFVGTFSLPAGPHLPLYTGGPLGITLALDADSVRLTSGTFDSGDLLYSSSGAPGFDSLDDLGAAVSVVIGTNRGGSGPSSSTVNYDSVLLDISGVASSPQEQASALIDDVQNLVTAGALNQGQANALIGKLNDVIDKLDRGQTNAACNKLNAFINQVNAFVNSRKLTAAQGQALIDAANAIGTNIGC